jgi:polysaccharide export outer membrane protein
VKKWSLAILLALITVSVAWAAGEQPAAPSKNGGPVKKAGPAPAVETVDSSYEIGPGDVLNISIWKDEALTKDVVVLPDGAVSFPLLGLLKASGKTVRVLKGEIEQKISEYVPEPVLNVEVKQVNSMIIYVIGRVNSIASGRYVLNTGTNVLQALAIAGGLNPFAKRQSIKVFRQEGGKTQIFRFHYDDVVDGKRLEENIELKRGDVVVVP